MRTKRRIALAIIVAVAFLGSVGVAMAAHPTQVVPNTRYYVDIGANDDGPFINQGFGRDRLTSQDPCWLRGDQQPDYTHRNQLAGRDNVVRIVVIPHRDLHLQFCIGHGQAQDTWELWVSGNLIVTNTNEQSRLPIVYYSDGNVTIPGSLIPGSELDLNFHNVSTDGVDGAGLWGILYWQ